MVEEHHFIAHLRLTMDYEKGMKERIEERGSGEQYLPGAMDFCTLIEPLVYQQNPTKQDLEFIHQQATVFLERRDFYQGIVVAILVQKLDAWLLDHDESFWNRSLWNRFGKLF